MEPDQDRDDVARGMDGAALVTSLVLARILRYLSVKDAHNWMTTRRLALQMISGHAVCNGHFYARDPRISEYYSVTTVGSDVDELMFDRQYVWLQPHDETDSMVPRVVHWRDAPFEHTTTLSVGFGVIVNGLQMWNSLHSIALCMPMDVYVLALLPNLARLFISGPVTDPVVFAADDFSALTDVGLDCCNANFADIFLSRASRIRVLVVEFDAAVEFPLHRLASMAGLRELTLIRSDIRHVVAYVPQTVETLTFERSQNQSAGLMLAVPPYLEVPALRHLLIKSTNIQHSMMPRLLLNTPSLVTVKVDDSIPAPFSLGFSQVPSKLRSITGDTILWTTGFATATRFPALQTLDIGWIVANSPTSMPCLTHLRITAQETPYASVMDRSLTETFYRFLRLSPLPMLESLTINCSAGYVYEVHTDTQPRFVQFSAGTFNPRSLGQCSSRLETYCTGAFISWKKPAEQIKMLLWIYTCLQANAKNLKLFGILGDPLPVFPGAKLLTVYPTSPRTRRPDESVLVPLVAKTIWTKSHTAARDHLYVNKDTPLAPRWFRITNTQ